MQKKKIPHLKFQISKIYKIKQFKITIIYHKINQINNKFKSMKTKAMMIVL